MEVRGADDVGGLWDSLRVDGVLDQGFVRLRISRVTACAAYAAIRVENDYKAFVVELGTRAIPADFVTAEASGVKLTAEPLTLGRQGTTRIILALTDKRFESEFKILVSDIVSRLTAAVDERDAARRLAETFHRWLGFLQQFGKSRLSWENRVGLLGELLILQELLVRMSPLDALRAWRGPTGANQDFSYHDAAIEVKTAALNAPHSVRISSLFQLEAASTSRVFLAFVHLVPAVAGRISLGVLIDSVRSNLPEPARQVLEQNLMAYGYLEEREREYPDEKFELVARQFFEVLHEFPRIRHNEVDSGVEDVKFSISLSACMPFVVNDDDVWQALGLESTGLA